MGADGERGAAGDTGGGSSARPGVGGVGRTAWGTREAAAGRLNRDCHVLLCPPASAVSSLPRPGATLFPKVLRLLPPRRGWGPGQGPHRERATSLRPAPRRPCFLQRWLNCWVHGWVWPGLAGFLQPSCVQVGVL